MKKKTNGKEQVAYQRAKEETRIGSYFALCSLLFALYSSPLWAQSPDSGGGRYVIEQRYVQQLVWIGDSYTLKYEVIIEQNDDGEYKAYTQEFTEKPKFQVSLPVGKYRYRIIPYDYLEQPGEASDWVNIEIKPAPTVSVEVQKPDDPVITGGGETEKPINFYVSAAWSPLIPLYGRMKEIFGNEFNAAGASVRFGVLFNKPRWFSPGIELLTSWYGLKSAQDNDTIRIQTGVMGFNFVAQKKFPYPKLAVTLKAGFAFAFQTGEIDIEEYSYTTGGLIPQINVEASFLWFVYKRLYLEAGLGFNHLIDKNDSSGCLRPGIGMGWQF